MNLAATMSLSAGAFLGPLASVRGQMAGLIGGLAALGGVTLSTAGFLRGLREALGLGGRMSDLSARTGIAVGDLVVLEQAFKNAGVSAEAVGPSINLMQRALAGISEAGENTQAVFATLGLNLRELGKAAPVEQLAQIADKIRALPSIAQQSAAAMAIFGRGGAQLLPLLKDAQALKDAADMVGRQGEVLARNAGHFDRASDILAAAPVKLRGFFVGAAESISASLLSALEQVNGFDFTTLGQRFGAAIAPYLEAIKSGDLWEIVRLQLVKAVAVGGAKLAQLLAVDLPALLFAGLTTPIIWLGDRLRTVFADSVLFLATQLNRVLPKKFEIDTSKLAPGAPGRDLGTIWDEQLNRIPRVDWGGDVAAVFAPAIDDLMGRAQEAADASRIMAQRLQVPGIDPIAKALRDFFGDLDNRGGDGKARAFSPETDRLARIGGFIGGPGGPALDYARRTARGVEQLVGLIRLVPGINPGAGQIAPTWA